MKTIILKKPKVISFTTWWQCQWNNKTNHSGCAHNVTSCALMCPLWHQVLYLSYSYLFRKDLMSTFMEHNHTLHLWNVINIRIVWQMNINQPPQLTSCSSLQPIHAYHSICQTYHHNSSYKVSKHIYFYLHIMYSLRMHSRNIT